jgi:hypothetical protein
MLWKVSEWPKDVPLDFNAMIQQARNPMLVVLVLWQTYAGLKAIKSCEMDFTCSCEWNIAEAWLPTA